MELKASQAINSLYNSKVSTSFSNSTNFSRKESKYQQAGDYQWKVPDDFLGGGAFGDVFRAVNSKDKK